MRAEDVQDIVDGRRCRQVPCKLHETLAEAGFVLSPFAQQTDFKARPNPTRKQPQSLQLDAVETAAVQARSSQQHDDPGAESMEWAHADLRWALLQSRRRVEPAR